MALPLSTNEKRFLAVLIDNRAPIRWDYFRAATGLSIRGVRIILNRMEDRGLVGTRDGMVDITRLGVRAARGEEAGQ